MRYVPGHGLLADADPEDDLARGRARRAATVEEAQAWLSKRGRSAAEILDLNLDGRTRSAWWHDELGFVQPGQDGARLVLIVDVPVAEPPLKPQSPPKIAPS